MLKKLHKQFVIVTVLLVGLILVGVMGMSLYSTYSNQQQMVRESLEHVLHEVNSATGSTSISLGKGSPRPNMLTAAVRVESDGTITGYTTTIAQLTEDQLEDTIAKVLKSGQSSGHIADQHIQWQSTSNSDGTTTIALVETSILDEAFSRQLVSAAVIISSALAALLLITWYLTKWMLKPVQEAWTSQRRFVADASHELKTPLAVILANSQILQADKSLPEDSRRWVDSTADEAQQMASLVNDLLTLARADENGAAAKDKMPQETLDFSDIVDNVALEFDAMAFERGCELESTIEPGLKVKGDAQSLKRLAKILVDNATKYAAKGTAVTLNLKDDSGHAVLSVNNLGTPIDPEDLPHVFERFYRSDKARTRETGGFGLGLAIAQSIAQTHGGTIEVASDKEHGTTFTVRLPETR